MKNRAVTSIFGLLALQFFCGSSFATRAGQLTVFKDKATEKYYGKHTGEPYKVEKVVERLINKGATFSALENTNYKINNESVSIGGGHGLGGAQQMRKQIQKGGEPGQVVSDYHKKMIAFSEGFQLIHWFYHHLRLSQYRNVPDGFGLSRLATTMGATKNSDVGVAVTDQQRYFPVDLASDVRTIELDGRTLQRVRKVMLGIGAGETENLTDLQRHLMGHDPATNAKKIRMMREFGEVLLGVWQATDAKPFNYNGEFFKIKDAQLQQSQTGPLQIGFAGQGPEAIKVAADLGVFYVPITFVLQALTRSYNRIEERMKLVGRGDDVSLFGRANIIEARPVTKDEQTNEIDVEKDWQKIRPATLTQYNKSANWQALLNKKQLESLDPTKSFEAVYATITPDTAEKINKKIVEDTLNHPYLDLLEPAVRDTLAHGTAEDLINAFKRMNKAGTNTFIIRMHGDLNKGLPVVGEALNNFAIEKIAPFKY